ncbi:hypothetical protein AAHC03_016583 [Spirometra sp. Aus1]
MTVQYNQDVLTGGPVVFLRLLLRWKGCVLKLIYVDLIVFLVAYALLSLVYRFALDAEQQRQFESVILYVANFQRMIPISFILGFYVQLVFNRFWEQFNAVPWVFTACIAITATIPGDGRARCIRRTCMRYMNASLIIASSRLHVAAKKRFPTTQHLVQAGILTQREGDLIDATDPVAAQPFLPLVWTTAIIMRAERDGLIRNVHLLVNAIRVVNDFRQSLLKLFLMDNVCVPLVYTQVVTLAVYSYFVSSIIGQQYIVNTSPYSKNDRRDYYVPFYTILEFIVYMGWLKVAETLVNPMGEDDEDFDINDIIDCNWTYSMHIMDKRTNPTQLMHDKFWNASKMNAPLSDQSELPRNKSFVGSLYSTSNAERAGTPSTTAPQRRVQSVSDLEMDKLEVDGGAEARQPRRMGASHNLAVPGAHDPRLPRDSLPAISNSTFSNTTERHGLQAVLEEDEEDHRESASPKESLQIASIVISPEPTPPTPPTSGPEASSGTSIDQQLWRTHKQIRLMRPPVDLRSPTGRDTSPTTEDEQASISKKWQSAQCPSVIVESPSTDESEKNE